MDLEEQIIRCIQCYPLIWDSKDPEYKNCLKKERIYSELATSLGIGANELKRKWYSLRSAFVRAHKKNRLRSETDDTIKKEWKHYQSMLFMRNSIKNTPIRRINLQQRFNDECEFVSILKRQDEKIDSDLFDPMALSASEDSLSRYSLPSLKKRRQINDGLLLERLDKLVDETDEDGDCLFGKMVTESLRKFKGPVKEMIKLRFQKIIFDFTLKYSSSSELQARIDGQASSNCKPYPQYDL